MAAKKSWAEKEYDKTVKATRIANWNDQIDYYRKEIRDICARVGSGDIEIGEKEVIWCGPVVQLVRIPDLHSGDRGSSPHVSTKNLKTDFPSRKITRKRSEVYQSNNIRVYPLTLIRS